MISRSLHLLKNCKNITQLKQAHALIITSGLETNDFALSRILEFCSNPSQNALSYAYKIFINIQTPTICVCNTMMKSFFLKDENHRTMEIYRLILRHNLLPDSYTLTCALKACANMDKSLNLGKSIHGHGVRLGYVFDNFVGNTLIAMYSNFDEMGSAKMAFDEIFSPCVISWTVLISGYMKNGDVYSARLVFDGAHLKDRGVWGAMLSGYVQNNCFKEGLQLFRSMQMSGVKPDEACFLSVLCACANLGSLEIGKWVHRYVEKVKMVVGVKLGTALIDMYSKCGCLDMAEKVFDKMPQRDVICWSTMISGYAMNGDGEGALRLFDEMERSGIRPDSVTFISLFTACSYSDMAQVGLHLLHVMCNVYHIEPKSEHYGCIIDLLSRARLIEEANAIIHKMPILSSTCEEAIAWRALLSACCSHGRVDLAEAAAERLGVLENHSGAYVLLSNAYAAQGRYSDAQRVRKMMRKRGVEKTPGCSSVEIDGIVHEFIAGEMTHLQMDEIYEVLEGIRKQLEPVDRI
ncbi:hypothetical protein CASFOL_003968 [Castilleja foliolosa]|uniref:Pentatricopeptide repeat-containing protein n=1 Tax=Castilleja foliolosa TaxID=1961234 RepID=A0ABD3EIQ2_9LAMI